MKKYEKVVEESGNKKLVDAAIRTRLGKSEIQIIKILSGNAVKARRISDGYVFPRIPYSQLEADRGEVEIWEACARLAKIPKQRKYGLAYTPDSRPFIFVEKTGRVLEAEDILKILNKL